MSSPLRCGLSQLCIQLGGDARARGGGQLQHAPFLTPSDATLADKRAYHRRLRGQAPAAEHAKAA